MWATSSVVPRIMCDYPYIMGMGALTLYDELTAKRTRFLRVGELGSAAAERGALPSGPELAAEARRPLKEKQGLEKAQGAFLAEILADPAAGTHLCHAMLLPHPRTAERLAEYDRTGTFELPGARLERQGKAAILTMRNPRYLNAEDETTIEAMRSEERRVGKECRSRWSPYQEKRNVTGVQTFPFRSGPASSARARRRFSRCATRATSTPKTKRRSRRWRSRSISRCSIARPRPASCAAVSSSTRSTPGGISSAPESTSRTSTRAASATSGT